MSVLHIEFRWFDTDGKEWRAYKPEPIIYLEPETSNGDTDS
jgi:hypothetical protein